MVLVSDVVHLGEPAAVLDAMLTGWEPRQPSCGPVDTAVDPRVTFIRSLPAFSESSPWEWTPTDVENFTLSLVRGAQRAARRQSVAIT